MNWQTTTILSNIATFDNPLDEAATEQLRQTKRHFAASYIKRFCRRAIGDSERVVPAAREQVQLDYSACLEHFCLLLLFNSIVSTL